MPPPASARRDPEAGITLVEMLVALAIFALVGLASFALLDTVIRTRDRTEGRLEEVAAIDRALILFRRDLGQSDPGSQTLADGALGFALAGAGGPDAMSYALAGETLERRTGALAQRLVAGVAGATFRLLDREGAWHDAWPPAPGQGEPPPLVGVEMRLDLAGVGAGVGAGAGAGAGAAAGAGPSTVRRLVELPLGLPPEAPPLAFAPEEGAAPPEAGG